MNELVYIPERKRNGPHHRAALSLDDLLATLAEHRALGRSIVFTNGCFDLLHVGHVRLLEEAAAVGDVLVVALNSDASVRQLKGPARPIVCEGDRAAMLAELPYVDHLVIFEDATPLRLLEAIRPDVLAKGGTYTLDEVVGREIVESYGGCVYLTSRVEGVSTTTLVEALRKDRRCPAG